MTNETRSRIQMKSTSDREIQLLINWGIFLAAPVIILPWLIYDLIKTKQFVKILVKGDVSIAD
jgi:ABC-type glycerol-3-phosphate transport system permease component